ncbi:hypothetical protein [Rhodopirellula bahusiensis]|uniref:hypothetical protein n=1 Tax=Rhodopirellula bahusiensis TaxID=2014065 RepID=UPI003264E1A1
MTTRIIVGLTQKIGQPNFGSLGATCQIEVDLTDRPDSVGLTERIRNSFTLCQREISRQLNLQRGKDPLLLPEPAQNGSSNCGTREPSPNRTSPSRQRKATDAQLRALHAIAAKANIHLATQVQADFGVDSPSRLSIRQASELIEKLKRQLEHR